MMPTSTVLLINEIVNYMYNWDLKSLCCGYNWVVRGLTGRYASCSLVFFLWKWSRNQWYPLVLGSSNSLSAQKSRSEEPSEGFLFWSPLSLSLSSLYMKGSIDATFLFSRNDGFPVIITFCVFSGSFCELQSHPWQRSSSFWQWID